MRSSLRSLTILVALLALGGCRSAPLSYNPATASVRTIGVAPIGMPTNPDMRVVASVGSNFGLVGDVVEQVRATVASSQVADILQSVNYDHQSDVRETLQQAFTAVGLPLSFADGRRHIRQQRTLLGKCPTIAGSDACLDVCFQFLGYAAAGPGTDYLPTVHLTARLTRSADGAVLFQDGIQLNQIGRTRAIVLQLPSVHRFKDKDAMQADPQGVAAGLREALDMAIQELAAQFKQ